VAKRKGIFKRLLDTVKWPLRRAYWWVARRVRPPSLPTDGSGKVMIHLGCGKIQAAGYVNVDLVARPHVHYVHPVAPLEMFADASADLIYASHVLEHLGLAEAPAALKEWRRVLKAGGVLRLAVPDFASLVQLYQDGKDLELIIEPLLGGQDDDLNVHKSAFDEPRLRRLLLAAGFRQVRAWDPQTADAHDFKDGSNKVRHVEGRTYPISLNLEAVK